jgi:hypothetical protein
MTTSPNISDNREFFNQLKSYFESQKVQEENTEALKKQIESENNNNPALNAFRSAQTSGSIYQAIGDGLVKSKETKDKEKEDYGPVGNLILKGTAALAEIFGLDEEEEPNSEILAYAHLIPRANIPGTLKEYELTAKEMGLIA